MALPVAHYLKIWTLRQGMMRDGVTHPTAQGRRLIDALVARLSDCAPDSPCDLAREPAPGGEWLGFVVEGRVLARLWVPDGDGEILVPDVPQGSGDLS